MFRNVDTPPPQENSSVLQVPETMDNRRRHSMAGPIYDRKLNTKFLSEGFEALGLNETDASSQLEKIYDYFENTQSRTKAFMDAEKNLQANHDIVSPILRSPNTPAVTHTWPLYVVEFKAGRTDYFYVPEEFSKKMIISIGDLAIVEADRGKDLGKIIECSIQSQAELCLYQATHEDPLVDSHNAVGKEIHPKRIFRIAEPGEVAMLLSKDQDEAKANALCQMKIRQKKLPMEIVDAEYQWDRRKLTFYFVADRRIDFRELVRELFKIYKTRIWMVSEVFLIDLVCCSTHQFLKRERESQLECTCPLGWLEIKRVAYFITVLFFWRERESVSSSFLLQHSLFKRLQCQFLSSLTISYWIQFKWIHRFLI